MSEIEPDARADSGFNLLAGFESQERRVADENGCVGLLQHRDGIGWTGNKRGTCANKLAEEDLSVGEGAAGGGVGGDRFYSAESVWGFDDELDGANFVQRSDRAAGDDREIGRERGNGDEAEVCASGEKLVGAERGLGVVEGVASGESGGQRWVLEVPHERSGIEEVDGGDAKHGW